MATDEDAQAAAAHRVEAVVSRIADVAASSQFQMLGAGSGHRRDVARADARRVAARSDRSALAERGRQAVADVLDARHGQFHPRIAYGWAADLTTATDRVEISLALQDLVLATAVEDLLPASAFDALAGDGIVLVEAPASDAPFVADGIEIGGPIDPDATPRGTIARIGIVAVAICIAGASFVVFSELGLIPAILVIALAVSILFTVVTAPSRRG